MGFKKMIVGFMIFVLVHLDAGYAQDEISDEDLEAIQILDILENLDLLEEDLDLLDTMTEIGDENEL
ncbi:MAG: hypothetical protein GQ571_12870 [Desulfobacterales bacterium]|nr:hypothetical protein [Desulfobacterales bacterium]